MLETNKERVIFAVGVAGGFASGIAVTKLAEYAINSHRNKKNGDRNKKNGDNLVIVNFRDPDQLEEILVEEGYKPAPTPEDNPAITKWEHYDPDAESDDDELEGAVIALEDESSKINVFDKYEVSVPSNDVVPTEDVWPQEFVWRDERYTVRRTDTGDSGDDNGYDLDTTGLYVLYNPGDEDSQWVDGSSVGSDLGSLIQALFQVTSSDDIEIFSASINTVYFVSRYSTEE